MTWELLISLLIVVGIAALGLGFYVVTRFLKKRYYRQLHRAKRAAGLVITDTKRERPVDVCNWIVTYDDGSTIEIEDEWDAPLVWLTVYDDADNEQRERDQLPPTSYV